MGSTRLAPHSTYDFQATWGVSLLPEPFPPNNNRDHMPTPSSPPSLPALALPMAHCSFCSKSLLTSDRALCSGCRSVTYCNAVCQRNGWASHRVKCGALKAAAAADAAWAAATPSPTSPGGDAASWDPPTLLQHAEAGSAVAALNLGICYTRGQGVAINPKEAAGWYAKAVGAPRPPMRAFAALAVCYQYGEGVAKDAAEAVRLFTLGAEAGDVGAMAQLGECLQRGEGVEVDSVSAFAWTKRAADAGHADAQFRLGHCLLSGVGCAVDAAEGVKYLRRSAVQGNETAMFDLALCSRDGVGVPKSDNEYVVWLQRARLAGDASALRELKSLEAALSVEERVAHHVLVAGVARFPPPSNRVSAPGR